MAISQTLLTANKNKTITVETSGGSLYTGELTDDGSAMGHDMIVVVLVNHTGTKYIAKASVSALSIAEP